MNATNQVPDYLIIEKDTFYFYDSPLEQLYNISDKVQEITNSRTFSSACWKGFYAEWEILNDTLYLSKVFNCEDDEEIEDFFEDIFGYTPPNNLFKAKWVDGILWLGKDLVVEKTLYLSIFRYEFKITVKKGVIEKTETTSIIECEYDSEDKVKEFLILKTDWTNFPMPKYRRLEIKAEFNVLTNGNIKNIKVSSSADSALNAEIIRTFHLLPCFQTYYFEGELFNDQEWLSITIREEDFTKYKK